MSLSTTYVQVSPNYEFTGGWWLPEYWRDRLRQQLAKAELQSHLRYEKYVNIMLKIVHADNGENLNECRSLFEEYATEWPGDDLDDEKFGDELIGLPGEYAPPGGRLLLAIYNGESAGCIALRKMSTEVCEMKRLYVRPQLRSHKIGRRLTEAIVNEAREIGYASMRLDTTISMTQAARLYESIGFTEIPPYGGKPAEDKIFLELILDHK